MSLDLGTLVAKFKLDDAELRTGLQRADKDGKEAGKKLGDGYATGAEGGLRKLGGMLAALGLGAAVVSGLSDSLRAISDLNEAASYSTLVWDDASGAMQTWSDNASRTMGLSKADALAYGSQLGTMWKQLGDDTEDAQQRTQTAMQQSADIASAANADVSQVADARSAAYRGEYDSIQKWIPLINAAAVEQEALTLTGKKNADQLTALEKAKAVDSLVTKQMSDMTGNYAATADQAANKQRTLNADLENAKAKLGDVVAPLQLVALGAGAQFIDFLSESATNLKGFGEWVQKNQEWLIPLGVGIGALAVGYGILAAAQAVSNAQSAIAAAGGIVKFIQAWAAQQAILNVVMAANPIGLVVIAIAALVAGLIVAYNTSETFRNVVDGAFRAIAEVGRWLWNNALAPVIRFIVNGFATVVDGIGDFLLALGNIPGFGWATDAGNMMKGAAREARGLASSINDIPPNKTVRIGVQVAYTATGTRSLGTQIGIKDGGVLHFDGGGVLPGYSPGVDNYAFWSPDFGTLGLSGGEAIMRPEFTRAVGGSWIDGANRAAKFGGTSGVQRYLHGLASGGTFRGGAGSGASGYSVAEMAQAFRAALDGSAVELRNGRLWFQTEMAAQRRSDLIASRAL